MELSLNKYHYFTRTIADRTLLKIDQITFQIDYCDSFSISKRGSGINYNFRCIPRRKSYFLYGTEFKL